MIDTDDITQFFCVVYEKKGRMYTCECKHLTRESADECRDAKDGLTIIEWVRDRDPQFEHVWTRPDMVDHN